MLVELSGDDEVQAPVEVAEAPEDAREERGLAREDAGVCLRRRSKKAIVRISGGEVVDESTEVRAVDYWSYLVQELKSLRDRLALNRHTT